jgi:hypothetical protein
MHLEALAARHALPVIWPFRTDAEAGGLMSYGVKLADAVLAQNLKINVTAVGRDASGNMQPKRLDAHSDGADRQLLGRP